MIFILLLLFITGFVQAEDSLCLIDTQGGSVCAETAEIISEKQLIDDSGKENKIYNNKNINMTVFYVKNCPHCKEAHKFLDTIITKDRYKNLKIQYYELSNGQNIDIFKKMANEYNITPTGVPTIFVGQEVLVGFYQGNTDISILKELDRLKNNIEYKNKNKIKIPIFGEINIKEISLPKFTLYLGLLDGLNPCAMWVLMFLLGLMIYAKSRRKVIFLGTVFIVSSGVVYFLFMATWLNLFLVIGYSSIVTKILASVAIIFGLINIKELFFFKKGISLMIPESAKPKLYKKSRDIINQKNSFLAIIGVILLAIFVNFIELACTIGLPAIFTRILSVKGLSSTSTYMYLALYNVAYIVPLATIVGLFAFTMGKFRFTETHGKIFKLISGILMLGLGLILIFFPDLLM